MLRNWAGNYDYRAERLHRPSTRRAGPGDRRRGAPIRVLGSRHSFNAIADSAELVTLDGLPADVAVDRAAGTVGVLGGAALRRAGRGARAPRASRCATSPRSRTSRSRARSPPRPTARATRTATSRPRSPALELVTSDGELVSTRARRRGLRRPGRRARRARRGHARDARRGAGLRGPPARVRGPRAGTRCSRTSTRSPRAATASRSSPAGRRDAPTRCGSRAGSPTSPSRSARSSSAPAPATVDRHPILGIDPVNCTPQLGAPASGRPGCPHFRMGFTPEQRRGAAVRVPRPARARRPRRSRRCARSPARSGRCCRSARSARSRPTASG